LAKQKDKEISRLKMKMLLENLGVEMHSEVILLEKNILCTLLAVFEVNSALKS
jgi:hypothetical protein